MRSYQREREDFMLLMVREGMSVDVARAILRDANTVQRFAAEACNRELSTREERRSDQAQARIALRVKDCGAGWTVAIQGDPRGACVKLGVPSGYSNCFCEPLVYVPTRRY